MVTRLMSMDSGFRVRGTSRGPLEILDGFVVRHVFDGETTLYVYGKACGEPFSEGGEKKVRVDDVPGHELDTVKQRLASAKGVEVSCVRLANLWPGR